MKRFFLSESTNFLFKTFGIQHILMISVVVISLIFIYIFKNKLMEMNFLKSKKFRILLALIIFINMVMYRVVYIYYGVYDIKIHLSLYYCHIVNYLFVLALLINYKSFYKYIYFLSWIGIWTILFPNMKEGIDCYIFYQFFISHNLIIILSTFIVISYDIKLNFKDCIKGIIFAIIIVLLTYVVNYDFNTDFNTPNNIITNKITNFNNYAKYQKYIVLILMTFIGAFLGYIINHLFTINFKSQIVKKKI